MDIFQYLRDQLRRLQLYAMPAAHKYFQDKLILLLLTVNIFLAGLMTVLIILRLISSSGGAFIAQYRSNIGVGAFQTGSVADILYFLAFAGVVMCFGIALSVRTYPIRRQLSITVLGMSALLIIVAIIVSNALLVLR